MVSQAVGFSRQLVFFGLIPIRVGYISIEKGDTQPVYTSSSMQASGAIKTGPDILGIKTMKRINPTGPIWFILDNAEYSITSYELSAENAHPTTDSNYFIEYEFAIHDYDVVYRNT